jgi:aminoglycoside phosphotransferase (APT) family kinase protein
MTGTAREEARPGAVAVAGLQDWLSEITGDPGPFRLVRLSGGNSNETCRVEADSGSCWVLRRPPQAAVSSNAHNLEREYRVLRALHDSGVPAPRVLGYTADTDVTPASCLLMEQVPGAALTDAWPAGWTGEAADIGAAARSAVDALAAVHTVDWRAAGLEGFGRPEGYLARQVSRWRYQYEQNQVRDLPLFEELACWLEANRPDETAPALLHGDFHLDNCLFVAEPRPRVSAVIDWELSAIGDPLVDLGLLLAFWGTDRPAPAAMPRIQALSRVGSAPTREQLALRYAERSGRSVDALPFYMALAFYKLAAIVEGAYANYLAGRVNSEYARALADDVPLLLAEAARFVEI